MKVTASKAFTIVTGSAGAIAIVSTIALIISQPATATPQFAKETGKVCGDCHVSAKGGGPLTPLGEKFKANGNKMPGQQ
jgi:mono/diheme cytochrome c family protein